MKGEPATKTPLKRAENGVNWYNFKVMRIVQPIHKQPNIIHAFKASIDTVSRHIYLLLFPILLDIFFLFGKRLLIFDQFESALNSFTFPSSASPEVISAWQEMTASALSLIRNFSLTAFLRSFPIGVPSLLAFRSLAENPLGTFASVQVTDGGNAFAYLLIFSLIGFIYGALFLMLISSSVSNQSFISKKGHILGNLRSLFLIPLSSIVIFLLIITPALILISVLSTLVPLLGSVGFFFLSIFLISMLIPMLFTPHEIALSDTPFFKSIRNSIKTVRPTNLKSSLFFFSVYLITYVTGFLWQIPPDNSWMLLISIIGHALVTTLLYVASFHFYVDARQCVINSNIPDIEPSQSLNQ